MVEHANSPLHLWKLATWRFVCRRFTVCREFLEEEGWSPAKVCLGAEIIAGETLWEESCFSWQPGREWRALPLAGCSSLGLTPGAFAVRLLALLEGTWTSTHPSPGRFCCPLGPTRGADSSGWEAGRQPSNRVEMLAISKWRRVHRPERTRIKC